MGGATVTANQIIESAENLGEVSLTAFNAIVDAEKLYDTEGQGEEKTQYVIAVVAKELGDQADNVGDALVSFINKVVSFLNLFAWATPIISVLSGSLTVLAYAPAAFGLTSFLISKVAEAIFEKETGKELDVDSGKIS